MTTNIVFPRVNAKKSSVVDAHSPAFAMLASFSYLTLGSSQAFLTLGLDTLCQSPVIQSNRFRYLLDRMRAYTAFKTCTSLREAIYFAATCERVLEQSSWISSTVGSVAQFALSSATVGLGVSLEELVGGSAMMYHPSMGQGEVLAELTYATMIMIANVENTSGSLDDTRAVLESTYHVDVMKMSKFIKRAAVALDQKHEAMTSVLVHNVDHFFKKLYECVKCMDAVFAFALPHGQSEQKTLIITEFKSVQECDFKEFSETVSREIQDIVYGMKTLATAFVTSTNHLLKLHLMHAGVRYFLGRQGCTLTYLEYTDVPATFESVLKIAAKAVSSVQKSYSVHNSLLEDMFPKLKMTFGRTFYK